MLWDKGMVVLVLNFKEGQDLAVYGHFPNNDFGRIGPKKLKVNVGRGNTRRRDKSSVNTGNIAHTVNEDRQNATSKRRRLGLPDAVGSGSAGLGASASNQGVRVRLQPEDGR